MKFNGFEINLLTIDDEVKTNGFDVSEAQFSEETLLKLISELEKQKLKLKYQNNELKYAKEQSRLLSEKFAKLYDLAPVGFFTLSNKGKIVDVNYNGAKLLGIEQLDLKSIKFSHFISNYTKNEYFRFFQSLFDSKVKQSCELKLQINRESLANILVDGIVDENAEYCFLTIVDITNRIKTEYSLKESEVALARQNELLTSLLKNLQIGVFMVEAPSGKPLLANDTAYKLLGRGILPDTNKYNLSEVYKAFKLMDHNPYPPEEMPIVLGMNGVCAYVDDMIVDRPDGTETLLEIYGSPITDSNGNVWASVVSFSDITDRKKTELDLKKSEKKFRSYIENAPEGIFVVNDKGYYHDVNPAGCKMLGYSKEELLKIHTSKIMLESSKKQIFDSFRILKELETYSNEVNFLRKDGSTFIGLLNAIKYEKNKFLGFVQDITEKKITESKLYESEFKFRTLADYSYDWDYWEAEDKSIVYISPSCERVTGFIPDNFYKNPELLLSIVHPEDFDFVKKHNDRIHTKDYADISEVIVFRVVNKDKSISYIEHICRPVYDEVENYFGRRISNRDITERKWAEDELLKAKDQRELILKNELIEKENQLIKYAKSLQDRDDYLFKVKNMLEQGKSITDKNNKLYSDIGKNIYAKLQNNDDWLALEEEFFKINPMFMSKLSTNYPNLTQTEIRVCAMIKLNMRSKEIASILNISQKTVDNHRLNIRRKLAIDDHTQLSSYLMKY